MEPTNQETSTQTQSCKAGVRKRFLLLWICYKQLFRVVLISIFLIVLLIIVTIFALFINVKKLDKALDLIWDKIPLES